VENVFGPTKPPTQNRHARRTRQLSIVSPWPAKKNAQDSRLACSVNVAEHDSAVFRSTTRIGSS
jgi:hypothetical protein